MEGGMDDDKPAELDSVARIRHHPRILRRRELAASINVPPGLEEAFDKLTDSELALLKIISVEGVAGPLRRCAPDGPHG
jgi:hypothetical protein